MAYYVTSFGAHSNSTTGSPFSSTFRLGVQGPRQVGVIVRHIHQREKPKNHEMRTTDENRLAKASMRQMINKMY